MLSSFLVKQEYKNKNLRYIYHLVTVPHWVALSFNLHSSPRHSHQHPHSLHHGGRRVTGPSTGRVAAWAAAVSHGGISGQGVGGNLKVWHPMLVDTECTVTACPSMIAEHSAKRTLLCGTAQSRALLVGRARHLLRWDVRWDLLAQESMIARPVQAVAVEGLSKKWNSHPQDLTYFLLQQLIDYQS